MADDPDPRGTTTPCGAPKEAAAHPTGTDHADGAPTLGARQERQTWRQRTQQEGPAPPREWKHVELPCEYVPAIGSVEDFAPERNGAILAIAAGCGTGKSTRFREFMEVVWAERPHARVLLLSANILYGTNLSSELRGKFLDRRVGFYKDTGTSTSTRGEELAECDVVVCSLESLHLVIGQQFEMCLIDEVRSIGRLIGGATMNNFDNHRLLTRICVETPRVVACDADLLFKVHDTEPAPLAKDFINDIAHGRPVVCASMTGPRPAHLARRWRAFFKHKKAVAGDEEWWRELSQACDAWHANHEHRIAVCVGTKRQLKQVCAFFEEKGVPWKPYCGDSNDEAKRGLNDPDREWEALGALVFTTTLSIGVDPKSVRFARCFMWTHHAGCELLPMFQAIHRFGRSPNAPLLNDVVDVLLGCPPPELQAALVQSGKTAPAHTPTFEEQRGLVTRRRGERAQAYAQMMVCGGGGVADARGPAAVTDSLLQVMAHSKLESELKKCQHYELFTRICAHYGWERVADAGGGGGGGDGEEEEGAPLHTDPDDMFLGLMGKLEQYEWALRYILRHDVSAFFDQCYGAATDTTCDMRGERERV